MGSANLQFHSDEELLLMLQSGKHRAFREIYKRYWDKLLYIYLTTKDVLPGSRSFFLRVGARIDYGLKYYNYTTVKTINIP